MDDRYGRLYRNRSGCSGRKADMGIDKSWPARFLLDLMERNPGVRYVNASSCVDNVRSIKDEYEKEKMRESSRINDACMEKPPLS